MDLTKKNIFEWFKKVREEPVRDNYKELLLNIEQALNSLNPESRVKYEIETKIQMEANREYTVLELKHETWKYPIELYFFKGECFKVVGY